MRQYELTYLISDLVPESDLNKVTGKIGSYISDLKGKVIKEEIWGRRKLAYPINKQDFATYVTIYFELPALSANDFDREIRLTNEVIRHLMIVKEYEHEEMTLTAEDIAVAAEVKNVVGGEKSFEAVEGETEESKRLMSVRESDEVKEEPKEEAVVAEEAKIEKKTASKKTEEAIESVEVVAAEEPKASTKAPKEKKVVAEEEKVEKKAKKPAKEKKTDEAERLTKLNEEIDDILKDEL